MILVIGGRSKIGAALIGELTARDQPVRALMRVSESAAAFPTGVEPIAGDLADADSLNAALRGSTR